MFEYKEEERKCTHKHIIELDMGDYENQMVLNRYVKALDMSLCINDILNLMRSKVKYTEDEDKVEIYERLRDEICDITENYGIIVDELIN